MARLCDGCHVTARSGRSGDPGTPYAAEWYCDRCWATWQADAGAGFSSGEERGPGAASAAVPAPAHAAEASPAARLLPPGWRRLLGLRARLAPGGQLPLAEVSEALGSMRISSLRADLAPQILQMWQETLGELRACTDFEELLATITGSASFRDFWVGPGRGPFLLPALQLVRGALSTQDVVHGLAAPMGKGRRKPCETALTLTDGEDFRCPVGLPPIRTLAELVEVLKYGTVFINTASLHWRSLAAICLAASSALCFPTNINVYITGENREVSTDVHTDNHDVFILHTEGAKRWRVYEPPARGPGMAHPLYRGKNEDKLLPSELGEPLLDVVLRPGEMLFIPMGFPHATGTAGTGTAGLSVHLTLGISTADYGFCFGGLRQALLSRLGRDASLDEVGLSDGAFWQLCSPTPVGCLVPAHVREAEAPDAALLSDAAACLREAVAEELQGKDLDSQQLRLVSEEAVAEQLARQLTVLESQEAAYREVVEASDGVFLATGPEQSSSDFRRSMLEHQAREDERKRQRAAPHDERFVKRIDPADGVARTKPELREILCGARGFTLEEAERYWEVTCRQLYPNDEPPQELMLELERAGEDCDALLYFLRKRTPHLRAEETWERVD